MKPKPKSVDAYLSALDTSQRVALERLRRAIRATIPSAKECVVYHLPAYRLEGKFLLAFGAAKFETAKGTIRFTPERPLPLPLIRKLVKTRVAEYFGTRRA